MADLYTEASRFINKCCRELGKAGETEARIAEVHSAIRLTGTYEHTFEELKYGARAAWRNSNRCIGRLFWESLHIFDCRTLHTADEAADALMSHIEYASNGGKVRPAITIFQPGRFRIWNHQLIRYAGYETSEGWIGDPDSGTLTKKCQELGWQGAGTPFDVLPLVIEAEGEPPSLYPIPQELVLEVPLRHPEYTWFSELGLQWYAVPIISGMALEIGGIIYGAAPFNGWYMGTEIGARNLADEGRYHMLPEIAMRMGLDCRRESSLWKDRALVELNQAVLYSYKEEGVSIVDHHTAARQFKQFEQREEDAGRHVTGDWTWLISPLSPAADHIFHSAYPNTEKVPNYKYQPRPY